MFDFFLPETIFSASNLWNFRVLVNLQAIFFSSMLIPIDLVKIILISLPPDARGKNPREN